MADAGGSQRLHLDRRSRPRHSVVRSYRHGPLRPTRVSLRQSAPASRRACPLPALARTLDWTTKKSTLFLNQYSFEESRDDFEASDCRPSRVLSQHLSAVHPTPRRRTSHPLPPCWEAHPHRRVRSGGVREPRRSGPGVAMSQVHVHVVDRWRLCAARGYPLGIVVARGSHEIDISDGHHVPASQLSRGRSEVWP